MCQNGSPDRRGAQMFPDAPGVSSGTFPKELRIRTQSRPGVHDFGRRREVTCQA